MNDGLNNKNVDSTVFRGVNFDMPSEARKNTIYVQGGAMIWKSCTFAALLAMLTGIPPAHTYAIASENLAYGYSDIRSSCTASGSHYVHPYCRKNGTCVRGHMAGNPGSREQWHLNKNGSDIVTHSNGIRETVPNVAPPK
jgi:hypothetical protein